MRQSRRRARDLWAYLSDRWLNEHRVPRYPEIVRDTGLVKSMVSFYLDKLEQAGHISRGTGDGRRTYGTLRVLVPLVTRR